MPETPVPRTRGRHARNNHNTHGGHVSKTSRDRSHDNQEKHNQSRKKEVALHKEDNRIDPRNLKQKNDQAPADPEEKFRNTMIENLEECSQQRLRALHMTFRRYGNVDNRILEKDLLDAFQENQVTLTPRILQMVTELYRDQHGIDYERLHRCLVTSHNQTGRDSVKARRKRTDLEHRPQVPQEKRDSDFLRRIEELLIRDQAFFDIDTLRTEFQSWDNHRSGNIKSDTMSLILADRTPLYGALLQNLVKRCDEEKNGMISWPMLLSFLEKGQNSARQTCPELATLPEKARATAAINVAPDPIDELSSSAKARVMSTLLKKANFRRENSSSPTPSARTATPEPVPSSPAIGKKTSTTKENAQKKEHGAQAADKKPNKITEEISEGTGPAQSNDSASDQTSSQSKLRNKKKGKEGEGPNIPPPLIEEDKISESGPSEAEEGKSVGTANASNVSVSKTDNNRATQPESEQLHEGPVKSKEEAPAKKITLPQDGVHTVAPKDYKPTDVPVDPPSQRLQLDWVYGCRGNDCRKNIHVLTSGEMVYFISNIVILYNRAKHTQRHYKEHTEDIKCVAVHSNGVVVASGQFASKLRPEHVAHIRVWRSDRLQTTHVIGEEGSEVNFRNAVMCLAFRPGEDVLAAVDNGSDKHLTVWDLSSILTCRLLAETYLNTETVCDLDFNPKNTEILATSGKEHLAWWKLYPESQKLQSAALPDYEMNLRPKYFVCLRYTDKGDLITGDSNGTVYIWGDGGKKITNFVKHGHDGPVLSVLYYRQHLITGGRDGQIQAWAWNKNMDKVASLQIPYSEGGVRNLAIVKDALIISTTMNSLLSASLADKGCPLTGVTLDPMPVTQGHFDELRGLAVIQQSFIMADVLTAGSDGVLCKFNTFTHGPVWKLYMKGAQFCCVDCSSTGELIVLGTKDGHVVILQLISKDMTVVEVLNKKITTEQLECIRLSPDAGWLVTGGTDRGIYVFRMKENEDRVPVWELHNILKGHRERITALDFAKQHPADVLLLRSSSAAPEQKFWDLFTCQEINGSDIETVTWASDTCTLDHLLTGVWSSRQALDGQLNALDVNPERSLVAMGNSLGNLSLYRFPCTKKGAFSHTYRCHQTVQSVRFTPSGNHIVTVGGHDSALMQWKLV